MKRVGISPHTLTRAKRLRADGGTWSDVEAQLGVGESRLRRELDPDYRARRNAQARDGMRRKRAKESGR